MESIFLVSNIYVNVMKYFNKAIVRGSVSSLGAAMSDTIVHTYIPMDFPLVKFVCDKKEAISVMEMV